MNVFICVNILIFDIITYNLMYRCIKTHFLINRRTVFTVFVFRSRAFKRVHFLPLSGFYFYREHLEAAREGTGSERCVLCFGLFAPSRR